MTKHVTVLLGAGTRAGGSETLAQQRLHPTTPKAGVLGTPAETAAPLLLSAEQVANGLLHDRAADFGNGLGERDLLGARLHAVLRIPALLDSAIAH